MMELGLKVKAIINRFIESLSTLQELQLLSSISSTPTPPTSLSVGGLVIEELEKWRQAVSVLGGRPTKDIFPAPLRHAQPPSLLHFSFPSNLPSTLPLPQLQKEWAEERRK